MGLCGSKDPGQAAEDGKRGKSKEGVADRPLVAGADRKRAKSISNDAVGTAPMEGPKILKNMSEHLQEQKGRNSMYGTSRPHMLTLIRKDIEDGLGRDTVLQKISSRRDLDKATALQSAAATFDTKGGGAKKKYVRKKRKLSIALADHIHDENEEAYVQHSVKVRQKNSGKLNVMVQASLTDKLQLEVTAETRRRPSKSK